MHGRYRGPLTEFPSHCDGPHPHDGRLEDSEGFCAQRDSPLSSVFAVPKTKPEKFATLRRRTMPPLVAH